MEFLFAKHVKIVVDFEIGETVLIEGWGYKLDGKHTLLDMRPHYGNCQSGILVQISGYNSWIDLGWLTKIPQNEELKTPEKNVQIS